MEENKKRPLRKVSFSKTETVHILKYADINGADRLYGGTLLSWIDDIGALTAIRHAGMDVTTAAIDNLVFKKGAKKNDIIILTGRVTYVGSSSMEVRVDSYVEGFDGMRTPINRAYLTYVCIDENGTPVQVPFDIEIETESERAEYEAAKLRKENRIYRRKEGF
jgi:acyl-CoA hydrolase